MNSKKLLAFIAAPLIAISMLTGCGGGSDVKVVAIYGDSITSGDELTLKPVPEIASMLGMKGLDYSRGGGLVEDHQAVDKTADLVIIRYAGANALHYGSWNYDNVIKFKQQLKALALTSKVPVIFTGSIRLAKLEEFPEFEYPVEAYNQKVKDIAAYEQAVKDVAEELGRPYINLNNVPFSGRKDLRDIVHPNQDYSTRLSRYIADEVQKYLGSQN